MKTKNGFNKIVLAVDGSEDSKKAAKKAFYLAKQTEIMVTILHVVQLPDLGRTPGILTPYTGEITSQWKEHGKHILNEIQDMGSKMGVDAQTKLIEGIPEDEIIKSAHKNDLIIMGSKGHSPWHKILIGSVSEKVLHHSVATVMIVR